MSKTRQAVVDLALSWIGKNEKNGSYKYIIDTYNSYKGQKPRGIKMGYGWSWCACTWSALAIKLGYTDIMPIEISCGYLIEAARRMDCWTENDGYIAQPGDAILYDWDDNGTGDNTGWPDHVGVVVKTDTKNKTFTVVEGNYSNAVKKRTIAFNGKYIRGFITPKYDEISNESSKEEKKMIYNYIDDNMPEFARPTIQKLCNKGILKGDSTGLNLTYDMLRIFTILDRAGVFDKE